MMSKGGDMRARHGDRNVRDDSSYLALPCLGLTWHGRRGLEDTA
jgi:hypothetical protein